MKASRKSKERIVPARDMRAKPVKKTAAAAASTPKHDHDVDYSGLLVGVSKSFQAEVLDAGHLHVFQTDATGLFDAYLGALPSDQQVHNCSVCRQFIERYGALVVITENGGQRPVMWNWDFVPEFYRPAFMALAALVGNAKVTGVYLDKATIWGRPKTGEWRHMAANAFSRLVYSRKDLTPGQAMALSRHNHETVLTALKALTPKILDEALRLLKAEVLERSEKFVAPVTWLRHLHDRPKGPLGHNILLKAIASAPAGYCHPRASVIGPLLEDIENGLPFDEIKRRFDAKLHALRYQRPQAAPSAGNIKAAEALVEKLGIAPALERRWARLDEMQTIWTPKPQVDKPADGGVFSHLKAKGEADVPTIDMPAVTMTWAKFARAIMPNAEKMQLAAPLSGPYVGMTTALHADAPPILKWDHDDARNPVAWYFYHPSSSPEQWGLKAGWVNVSAISDFPNCWGDRPMPFMTEGVIMLLEEAHDINPNGNRIFPETLRDELHSVRATVEAFSKAAKTHPSNGPAAAGYGVNRGGVGCSVRVFTAGAWTAYKIDRWD